MCDETSDKARNNKLYSVASLRQAALSVMPCETRLCKHCDLVALSVLLSPLDSMCNLNAKLMLLLHHINDRDRNKEAILQFS